MRAQLGPCAISSESSAALTGLRAKHPDLDGGKTDWSSVQMHAAGCEDSTASCRFRGDYRVGLHDAACRSMQPWTWLGPNSISIWMFKRTSLRLRAVWRN